MRAPTIGPVALLAAVTLLALPRAHAQATARDLSGRVSGLREEPVPGAEVRVLANGEVAHATRTDSAGRYAITAITAAGRLSVHVRRLGFKPALSPLPATRLVHDVVLEPMPAELEEVIVFAAVHASRGRLMQFHANRARAQFGKFFDRDEIEAKHPRVMSDLMRFVPGARLVPGRIGNVVRIRGCRPLLWVDGVRLPGAELDETVNVADVAAIEIYNSFAGIPPQYVDRGTNCGAVVVWTRVS